MSTTRSFFTRYAPFFGATIALALFVGGTQLLAQWTPAPASPPSNNVEAPINVGTSSQVKAGGIGSLDGFYSNKYCDINGLNCFSPTSISLLTGGGIVSDPSQLIDLGILNGAIGLEPGQSLFVNTTISGGRPLGDINDNGSVQTSDALVMQRYYQGLSITTDERNYIENELIPYVQSNSAAYTLFVPNVGRDGTDDLEVGIANASASQEPARTLFIDNTISGRPLGDINNDGSVQLDDAELMSQYYVGILTSGPAYNYIVNELIPYVFANSGTYSSYIGTTGGGGADTLASLSCAVGEVPSWNGTAWQCAAGGTASSSGGWVNVDLSSTDTFDTQCEYRWNHSDIGVQPWRTYYGDNTAGEVWTYADAIGPTRISWSGAAFNEVIYIDHADKGSVMRGTMNLAPSTEIFFHRPTAQIQKNCGGAGGNTAGGGFTPIYFSESDKVGSFEFADNNNMVDGTSISTLNATWQTYSYPSSIPNDASAIILHYGAMVEDGEQITFRARADNFPYNEFLRIRASGADQAAFASDFLIIPYSASREIELYFDIPYGGGTKFGPGLTFAKFAGYVTGGGGGGSVTMSGTDTLASLSCSTDQIAQWNGSAWECTTLPDKQLRTTYMYDTQNRPVGTDRYWEQSCPAGWFRTGCSAVCRGDEIDLDVGPASGEACAVDANSSCTGGTMIMRTICARID